MERKTTRQILYNKKEESPIKIESPIVRPPLTSFLQNQIKTDPEKVVKWIRDHKYFKWALMCKEAEIDKGNFQRVLKSEKPSIPETQLSKILPIIKEYGYL